MKYIISFMSILLTITLVGFAYYLSTTKEEAAPIKDKQGSEPEVAMPIIPAEPEKNYFTGLYLTEKEVPVYDNNTEELIGVFSEGVKIHLNENLNGDYFTTPIENAVGIVKSDDLKLLEKREVMKQPVSDKSFYLTSNEYFYIDEELSSPAFMGQENRRYPVLFENDEIYQTQVAGLDIYISKNNTKLDRGIPVLMYHHLLRDAENKNYRKSSTTITDAQFKTQMAILKEMDYRTITPNELDNYLEGRINLSVNSILITFDDGLKSNLLYAYPVLKENGFKATNFIIANRVKEEPTPFNPDSLQFLSKPELKQIEDVFNYEGHTYGMHNLTMINGKNVPDLLSKTYEEIDADFNAAENNFSPSHFAYPFGMYDNKAIEALKKYQYKTAYTTKEGYVNRGDKKLELKRLGVYPTTTTEDFKEIVNF